MGFAAGYSAGADARLKRQELLQARDTMNLALAKEGYTLNSSGGLDIVKDGAADLAKKERNVQAQQIAIQSEAVRSLQGKLSAMATDSAIEDFVDSGNAEVFQRAMNNDPFLKKAWNDRGVQLVTNIDFENDKKLLESAGITQDYSNDPKAREALKKNIWKYYDGSSWNIGSLSQLVAETGALNRISTKRHEMIVNSLGALNSAMKGVNVGLETQKVAIDQQKAATDQQKAATDQYVAETGRGQLGLNREQILINQQKALTDQYLAETGRGQLDVNKQQMLINQQKALIDQYVAETGRGQLDVNKQQVEVNKQKAVTDQQKAVTDQYVAETGRGQLEVNKEQTDINKQKLGLLDEQIQKNYEIRSADLEYKNKKLEEDSKIGRGGTGKQKDMLAAEQQTTNLLKEFGGEEAFFNTDFSNPENYNKAYKYISKIENYENTKLSEADKKELASIRQLIALADPAKKLSSTDTGLLDNFLGGVEKYVSDNVKGVEAKSAYNAYRNTVRNALFGSALTKAEMQSFDEAFGKLDQKLAPVLAQFKTSLVQVKAKLESIQQSSNPYTMKVRTGVDSKKLDSIISALDSRIQYMSGSEGNKTSTKENYSPLNKPTLDEIFNRTKIAK